MRQNKEELTYPPSWYTDLTAEQYEKLDKDHQALAAQGWFGVSIHDEIPVIRVERDRLVREILTMQHSAQNQLVPFLRDPMAFGSQITWAQDRIKFCESRVRLADLCLNKMIELHNDANRPPLGCIPQTLYLLFKRLT